jgi:hypothetical protein
LTNPDRFACSPLGSLPNPPPESSEEIWVEKRARLARAARCGRLAGRVGRRQGRGHPRRLAEPHFDGRRAAPLRGRRARRRRTQGYRARRGRRGRHGLRCDGGDGGTRGGAGQGAPLSRRERHAPAHRRRVHESCEVLMRRHRRELHRVERAHRATRRLRKRLEPFVRLVLVGATRAEQRTRAWPALRVQRALEPDREDVKLRALGLLGAFVDDDAIRERQPLIRYERRLGRVVMQLECSLCIAREDEEAPVPARRARAQP